jgi:hypothetical protein
MTVNTASSVSKSEALLAAVRCSPHTSAAGPSTAPNRAINITRARSARRSALSCACGARASQPMTAAPTYSSAAVVKTPVFAATRWISGVLAPNSTAANSASAPPDKAGQRCVNDCSTIRTSH